MQSSGKLLRITILLVCLLADIFYATAQKHDNNNPEWSQDYKPFRIAGNLYYVGTYDIGCYLITTPAGHILINTGLDSTVPMIRAHIEAMGFRFSDIKILLSSQAHFDHVGGMAEIKRQTKAKVMIDEGDAAVMEDGGNSDYLFGGKGIGSMFEPVKVDRLLHDKDTIKLGDMQVVMLHHPGHTKGSSSYLFDVKDKHRKYRVLIANMPTILDGAKPGMASYPGVAKDYAYTLKSMKNLHFDLWLAAHASQCHLHEKHKPGDAYRPKAFMDRKGYDEEIDDLQKAYREKLGSK